MLKQQTILHPSVNNIKTFQEVTGTLLYYARSVDPTVLILLGSIAAEQAKHTDQTMQKVKQLLDHAASHLDYVSV